MTRPSACLCLACSLLCGLAMAWFAKAACAEVVITDDQGETVRLEKPASRVIALSGALAEILAAMGEGDALVARTDADADIPALKNKPSVGTHMRPNLELVLGARPDLVIQLAGRKESLESVASLRRLGLPVAVFRIGSFAELFSAAERLGVLTGAPGAAETLINGLGARLSALRAKWPPGPKPRVFFEVRYPNLLGAGRDSIVSAEIEAAGGENVLAAEAGDKRVVRLGEEELARLDPGVYVVQRGPMNENPVPPADRPHFSELPAVRAGRVYEVSESLYSRPGPGAVTAAEELFAMIHEKSAPKGAGETQ